jgi:DNA polymerase-3 subunit epsilon
VKTQNKFWWFVLVAVSVTMGALLTILILFWQQLPADQQQILISIVKENFAYFFMAGVLMFTGFGFTLDWFFRFYIIPVNQLAEEIQLKSTVNPQHIIDISGSHDVMRLAQMIQQRISGPVSAPLSSGTGRQQNRAAAESEKDILAALLEGLPQGIVVCNIDAKIVFHNRKAREILGGHSKPRPTWIGLGRSLYTAVDESLVKPALERIAQKLDENQTSVSERFLIGIPFRHAISAEIVPVLDRQHHLSGFIIYMEDSSASLKQEQEILHQFQSWQQQLTQSISVIKATAEVLDEGDTVKSAADREKLIRILSRESGLAADILTKNEVIRNWRPDQPLPLTLVNAAEWYPYLRHRAAETIGLDLNLEVVALNAQISIDMHHLTNALLFVLDLIQLEIENKAIGGKFFQRDAWLYMDLTWHGKGVLETRLKGWKAMMPRVKDMVLDISLGDILAYHGAKLWRLHPRDRDGTNGIRLLLPAWDHAELFNANGHVTILPDSRPEFYDFDLFQQAGQTAAVDDMSLEELSYTVFDTETTGLDPQGGDEIISIGALRIVNGRQLKEERFDQLVNPCRNLPWASVKYHGIRPEMLTDKPTIEQVLPSFFEFCQDTVMVGHNVAFDMRMLQLKEEPTGVKFINPVLDTMLLSAVVHPAQNDHSMSAIAQRLGITIVGRHTALGDATATGQIFLKLIPLLKDNGIVKFQDARRASEKTFYARLKY